MKLIIASFAFLSLAVGAGYWSGDANRLAALAASGIASQAPLPEYLTGEVVIGHIERSIAVAHDRKDSRTRDARLLHHAP